MNLPRVTTLIAEMGLLTDSTWFEPKHRRRGRLVHAAAHLIAQGKEIDEAWYGRHSGEAGDDRIDHEECLPYLDGVRNAIKDNDIFVDAWELEVEHRSLRYQGHLDWDSVVQCKAAIIDLKCGMDAKWHPVQTALYAMARTRQIYDSTKVTKLYRRYALYLGPQWGARNYKLVEHNDPYDYKAAEHLALAWWDKKRYGSSN